MSAELLAPAVIDLPILRRWAEDVAFAIDATERERVDALLELAEQIEAVLAKSERAA